MACLSTEFDMTQACEYDCWDMVVDNRVVKRTYTFKPEQKEMTVPDTQYIL